MIRKRYTEEQIIAVLKEAETGALKEHSPISQARRLAEPTGPAGDGNGGKKRPPPSYPPIVTGEYVGQARKL